MKKLLLLMFLATSAQAEISVTEESPDRITQLYFLSMAGAYEHISGSPHRAEQTYHQLTELAPESIALKHAALRLAFERQAHNEVIEHSAHVDVSQPSHEEAATYLAQSYLFTGHFAQSLELLHALRKLHPENDRYDYFIALCHMQQHNISQAHRVVDAALVNPTRASKYFLFHFLKGKMLLTEEKWDKARYHILKTLEHNPRFSKGILLHGALLEKSGDVVNAVAAYEKYIALSKDPAMTKKVIALHFDMKNFERARALLLTVPQDNADYFHDLALVSFKLGDHTAAHAHLATAFTKNPTHQRTYSLTTELLLTEGNYSELKARYTDWLGANPRNLQLLRQWYGVASKGMALEHVTTVLINIARTAPTYQLCFALGDLFHQHKQFANARSWYHTALADHEMRPGSLLESKLRFQIACTHYHENEYTLAYDEVQKALACSPPYPSAHNVAALIIIEAGGSLVQAQDHVDAALFAQPSYPPYQDTQRQLRSITLSE